MYFTWFWSGPHHTFPSTTTRDRIESRKIWQLIGSQKNGWWAQPYHAPMPGNVGSVVRCKNRVMYGRGWDKRWGDSFIKNHAYSTCCSKYCIEIFIRTPCTMLMWMCLSMLYPFQCWGYFRPTLDSTRTVIDIHFLSIRSLTFYFSIPIISIRFWRTALIEYFHMFHTIFVARILRFAQCKDNEGFHNTFWLNTWVSLQNSY